MAHLSPRLALLILAWIVPGQPVLKLVLGDGGLAWIVYGVASLLLAGLFVVARRTNRPLPPPAQVQPAEMGPHEHQPEFDYVYVNQDGSARELSPRERTYLSTEFSGGDGGRPYIKATYDSRDGWGSLSGFLARRSVPANLTVEPVRPDYDPLEHEGASILLGQARAAGDVIVENADGSVTCTPNPRMSHRDRFELSRRYWLDEQRRREESAKVKDCDAGQ